jgi:branched-chain amino acid aminotransferase
MEAFPPLPVGTIDWTNLKDSRVYEGMRTFQHRPQAANLFSVNGHIESTYTKVDGKWSPLKFVSDPYMRIHGMAPGLNYGQQALEGFKAFRMSGESGAIALFRPDRNAVRFQHSLEVLAMPPVPSDMFLKACRAAVALNATHVPPHGSGWALYVRPQIYGTSAHLGLTAPDEYTFCVFVVPIGMHLGTQPIKALILDEFDRAAPKGTGHAKVGGNYAPVLRWSDQAKKDGFGITLHLDSARHEEVDEFSMCGFVGVRYGVSDDDVTLVVPDSPCIIDSVTSDSVQQVARSFGWKVEKRALLYTELPLLSEVLGAGTAVTLVPIKSITRRKTRLLPDGPCVQSDNESETVTYLSEEQSNGGPVYRKLLARLRGIQTGDIEDNLGWRFEIEAKDQHVG